MTNLLQNRHLGMRHEVIRDNEVFVVDSKARSGGSAQPSSLRGSFHTYPQPIPPSQGNRISSCPCQYLQQVPFIETAKESFLPDAEGSGALLS